MHLFSDTSDRCWTPSCSENQVTIYILCCFFLSNMEYFVWFCFQGAGLRHLSLLATASSTAEEILLPANCAGQVPPFFHVPEKTFVLLPLLTASPELVQLMVLQPPQLVTTSPAVWWRWACCRPTFTQAALNYWLPFFFLLVLFVFLLTHSEDKNVAYFLNRMEVDAVQDGTEREGCGEIQALTSSADRLIRHPALL